MGMTSGMALHVTEGEIHLLKGQLSYLSGRISCRTKIGLAEIFCPV